MSCSTRILEPLRDHIVLHLNVRTSLTREKSSVYFHKFAHQVSLDLVSVLATVSFKILPVMASRSETACPSIGYNLDIFSQPSIRRHQELNDEPSLTDIGAS